MARKIEVEILGDASSLERSFKRAGNSARGFDRKINQAGRGGLAASGSFNGLGRSIAFASGAFLGGAGLVSVVRSAFSEMSQSATVTAQTNAALKSTGGVAGVTAGHIDKLGKSLLAKSGVDDETIRSGANMLLTFRQIRNEAGKGNKVFDQASRAILNMDVAMSHGNVTQESLSKKAILVGKALNDPIKGLTSLRRVGVAFTDQQTAQIKAFVKSGNVLGAQKVIIRELNAEFGGSAAALGQTLPGKINIARESFRNLGGTLATQLVPGITRVVDRVNRWISNTQNQVRVQRTFASIVRTVSGVLRTMQSVITGVDRVTGSFANTVKILIGVFVALKAVRIAAALGGVAGQLTAVGAAAGGASGRVSVLKGRLLRLVANPYTATIAIVAVGAEVVAKKIAGLQKTQQDAQHRTLKPGDGAERALVPRLAKQINEMKKAGQSGKQIISKLRNQLGGSELGDQLISQAFRFQSGADPKLKARITKQIAGVAKHVTRTLGSTAANVKTVVKRSATEIAQQQNQWFDALLGRRVDRVQDIGSAGGQLGALSKIAGTIKARIAITKDVTRKLNLEDQLLGVVRQQRDIRDQQAQAARQKAEAAKQKRADAAAALIDSLQFGFEKAQTTSGFKDDFAALGKLESEIKKRIKTEGKTVDLQRQLFQVQQDRAGVVQSQRDAAKDAAQKRQEALTARQFVALGFDATGADKTPGKKNLQKRLGNISDAVKGTILDTGKTRSLLSRVRNVLAEGIVPKDVRAKIKEVLDGVNDELKDHKVGGSKFRHADPGKLLEGIGLGTAQARALKLRLATVGAGGAVPKQTAQFATARGGGGVHYHGDIHVNGVTNVGQFEDHLAKRAGRRPQVRRGAR